MLGGRWDDVYPIRQGKTEIWPYLSICIKLVFLQSEKLKTHSFNDYNCSLKCYSSSQCFENIKLSKNIVIMKSVAQSIALKPLLSFVSVVLGGETVTWCGSLSSMAWGISACHSHLPDWNSDHAFQLSAGRNWDSTGISNSYWDREVLLVE